MAFSNDECAKIYDCKSKKFVECFPGHTGARAKNGMVNGAGSMVATTGSDGFINIYEITRSDSDISVKFATKI